MFNWLGTWLGNWFGSSEPAPVGAMSGSASFSLSASATLTSTGATTGLMMGAASLSISTTATGTVAPVQPATGNFWSAEFWADGFWSYGFWGESRAVEYAHSGYWRLFYYNLQEQALEARNKLSVVSAPYKKPIAPVKSSTRQLVQRRSLSKIVDNTEGEASTEPCIPKAPLKPIYRTKNLIDRVELAQYLQPIVYELGGLVAVAKTSKAALEAEASVFDSEAIALLLLAA